LGIGDAEKRQLAEPSRTPDRFLANEWEYGEEIAPTDHAEEVRPRCLLAPLPRSIEPLVLQEDPGAARAGECAPGASKSAELGGIGDESDLAS